MFLTRSKTSSAINEQQQQQQQQHTNTSTIPIIPHDMLLTFENAVPNLDSALGQILPDNAKHLMLDMISSWIVSSRIALNNNKNKQLQNQSNKPTLRSWAIRSFSLKPKPVVAPMQLSEFSDKAEGNHQSSSPPSLVNSCRSTLSSEEDNESLYTPMTDNVTDAATTSKQPFSRLPVSLKSMIDLLDTPPLIPDSSTLSLIEESLTPLTSTFFEGQNLLTSSASAEPVATSTTTAADSAANNSAISSTLPDDNHSHSVITTIASRDSKSIGHSISTIFTQLGNSMKKAFKKRSSITQLKKTFSVQHHLSLNKEQTSSFTPPNEKTAHRSFSSLTSAISEEKNQDSFESIKQRSPLNLDIVKVKEDVRLKKDTAHSLATVSSQDVNDVQCMPSHDSFDRHMNSSCWDGDSTQSQQFDKLLDDIWERSQEYQDYFAAQEGNKEEQEQDSLSKRASKQAYAFLDYKHGVWSPSLDDGLRGVAAAVRASRTEGNMNSLQNSIPYVCVGKQQRPSQRSSIPRPVNKKLHLDIEDVKTYKKSTSVYSNIKDYDIQWQQSFHEAQKSRDKVANTLKSVSWAFYSIIKRNHSLNAFDCDVIFDENESNMEDTSSYDLNEPLTEWNDVYDQLAYVFDCGELTAEHAIITFMYVKRMLDLSRQKLWDFSWRMIIMAALLTAVKVWDDCAIFNADFAMIFPELSLDVINMFALSDYSNNIERVFLTHLQWDVSVNCSEFAKTYFHLRDIEHMMDQW
ncbi:hypothetical protein [Parasitella parasitica]|uniref:Cyclin N-terminal domain-containing protein n=1 Tax=Parasitella parasitica TaxID=35722 RepID=A0A0B7NW71_9FUNG|nr:hypothetical protein [Parasitella parasitica]